MRLICWLLLGIVLAAAGCGTFKSSGRKTAPDKGDTIVTPSGGLTGRVSLVNQSGHYAIVSFPLGHPPAAGQFIAFYRNGLKVGEAKVNGPQMDNLVTTDLTKGDCRVGDEARLQ